MRKYGLLRYVILLSCLFFFFGGCAGKKKLRPNEMGHKALLDKGLQQLKVGEFKSATKTLQSVVDRYPYTKAAIIASLKLADAYYVRGDFDTAFDLYDKFVRYHPRDPNSPHAMYQMGMCHFSQVKSFDRDQTHILKAENIFVRLIRMYPNSEYANKARKNLRTCLTYLARYEVFVGNFYFKHGDYLAALGRYTNAIKNYPDMGQYNEALEYMSKCKRKLAEAKRKAEIKEAKAKIRQ